MTGPGGSVPALSRSGVDRATVRRTDDAWLAEAWRSRGVLLLLDAKLRVLVDGGEQDPQLVLLPADGPLTEGVAFLGQDDAAAYFCRQDEVLPEAGGRVALLREIGDKLGDRDSGLLTHAVALLTWLGRSVHCPRCGAATDVRAAGSLRVCPVDGFEQHPRTDPAMIVLVTTPDRSQAVLGRNVGWPEGLFSCLAGFVEPGESAELSVLREVQEEVGLAVRDVRYTGSQPWPFPSSLMLAYTAVADHAALNPDPDEISDARWLSRSELRTAIADGTMWAPPSVSIARRLIDTWLADDEP